MSRSRGHIKKRANGTYTIYISVSDPVTGKRKQMTEVVHGNKKDADKRLTELLHQRDTGTIMKPGKTPLGEFLKRWLTEYAEPNLAPRSIDRYRGIINKYLIPDLGSLRLTQLKPEHLQKHYHEKLSDGLSAGTVRYHHAVIHKALQTAVKWGLSNRNIADAVDPPRKQRKEMETWSEDEVKQFLTSAENTTYYALFSTNLFTGMRRSELLALRWKDVDFIYSRIYINRGLHQRSDGTYVFTDTKSEKSRRAIDIYGFIYRVLKEHKAAQELRAIICGKILSEDDLVFLKVDGHPLRPNTVTRAWGVLAKQCGLKVIRFHDARHTHASLLLKQSVHPKVVQERLGHSSIQITLDTYSHLAEGLQEAAAKAFDQLVSPERKNVEVEKVG